MLRKYTSKNDIRAVWAYGHVLTCTIDKQTILLNTIVEVSSNNYKEFKLNKSCVEEQYINNFTVL